MASVSKTELLLADTTVELANAVIALSRAISLMASQDNMAVFEYLNKAVEAANQALDVVGKHPSR